MHRRPYRRASRRHIHLQSATLKRSPTSSQPSFKKQGRNSHTAPEQSCLVLSVGIADGTAIPREAPTYKVGVVQVIVIGQTVQSAPLGNPMLA